MHIPEAGVYFGEGQRRPQARGTLWFAWTSRRTSSPRFSVDGSWTRGEEPGRGTTAAFRASSAVFKATVLCAAILRASRMAAGLAASSLQSSACRMPSRSLAPLYIGKRRAALAAAGASAAEFAHVARPVLIVEQP